MNLVENASFMIGELQYILGSAHLYPEDIDKAPRPVVGASSTLHLPAEGSADMGLVFERLPFFARLSLRRHLARHLADPWVGTGCRQTWPTP